MKPRISCSLFLLFLIASCRQSPEQAVIAAPDLESLHQAVDAFNKAYAQADVAALEGMLTVGYLHTNGKQPPVDKKAWLNYVAARKQAIGRADLAIDSYQMLDTQVRMHGSAAVVCGRVRVNGLNNDGPFEREYRVTHLWAFEDGRWKRAAFHDGRIK